MQMKINWITELRYFSANLDA